MPTQTTTLFFLDDLEDVSRTRKLADSDLNALRAVAGWIKGFVAKPHKDLGRAGSVCPFVPVALERELLCLAPERITGRSVQDVVELMNGYKSLFLGARSNDDDANYRSMVVVFTDLASDRAKDLFDGVLQHLSIPSYTEDGLVLGGFYEGNEGSAIYNPSLRPFTAPVPFLLMRHAVVSDWKFFLDNENGLSLWARRYGEAAVQVLAEELRRFPWRSRRDVSEGDIPNTPGDRPSTADARCPMSGRHHRLA